MARTRRIKMYITRQRRMDRERDRWMETERGRQIDRETGRELRHTWMHVGSFCMITFSLMSEVGITVQYHNTH